MIRGLLLAVVGLVWPVDSLAAVRVDQQHLTWSSARPVDVTQSNYFYGALSRSQPARFYTWTIVQPTTVTIEVGLPRQTDSRFNPALVLYQPSTETVGPVLPMEQPPKTMASVYPASLAVEVVEKSTQISYQQRRHLRLALVTAGQYYLAVYTPAPLAGRYRLAISAATKTSLGTLLTWPKRWWYAQIWAGYSWETLWVPGMLIAIVAGGVLVLQPKSKKLTRHTKRYA